MIEKPQASDLPSGTLPPGIVPPQSGLLQPVDWVVGWARANSLWPLVFGTSCCAIEMMATGASDNDWARFGLEVARASPRQADLIILAGTITEKMGSRLVTLHEQMPGPKYVIAMGACTISGGPFYYDNYSVVKGADRLIPVDVYIPGCPPRPEALLYGVMQLQKLIRAGGWRRSIAHRPVNISPIVDPMAETLKEWEALEAKKQEDMKEAKERFKLENPDYKGVVIKRVVAPKYDEVAPVPRPERGLPPTEIFANLSARFPALRVHGLAEDAPKAAQAPAAATEANASTETPAETPAEPAPAAPRTVAEKIAAKVSESKSEYVLDVAVDREDYLPLIRHLRDDASLRLDYLIELTAVDWKDRYEVIVHLLSVDAGHKVFVRCALPHVESPEIETLSGLFPGANWHEREAYDFFGIRFLGHPDLRRLFLEDDFPGHPLRKDFEYPERIVKRPY